MRPKREVLAGTPSQRRWDLKGRAFARWRPRGSTAYISLAFDPVSGLAQGRAPSRGSVPVWGMER